MCPKLYRLMRTAKYTPITCPMTTAITQMAGYDPLRLRVILAPNAGTTMFAAFSDATPTSAQFIIVASTRSIVIPIEEFGQSITMPIWLWTAAGSYTSQALTTVSGLPAELDRFCNGY